MGQGGIRSPLSLRTCYTACVNARTPYIVTLSLLALSAHAATVNTSINTLVNKAIARSKQPINIGIVVQSMQTGKTLYTHDANHLFLPASTMKLFTATAALAALGPDYRFNTRMMTNSQTMTKGTLNGNLWFVFNGDPSFTRKNLQTMIASLKKDGISHIKGRVFLDANRFDQVNYAPGWIWDDLSYAYAAPVNGAILNENKFTLTLTPAKTSGFATQLTTPHLPQSIVRFKNTLPTLTTYNPHCVVAIYQHQDNHYWVNGCYLKAWGTQHRSLAITDPRTYARILIRDDLKKSGITYRGKITNRTAPANANELGFHSSKPLRILITHMLKKSDNLYADSLFKTLGATYFKTQGTWQNGAKALVSILGKDTTINFDHSLITDGAGLSRYNLITPRQLSKLLYFGYHDMDIEPELLTALPIAGYDGTLTYRMSRLKKPRVVRGKTGTMNGVSALAGFLSNSPKHVLSYVIIINNFIGSSRPYREIEDKIAMGLARNT
jgi:serine-type D-Ala-D-Ala carboxypeptidase/endopeptidase (penicillin-binding protein 4)